ncbi:MAG: hypothetical protein H6718_24985 [Polyangiaceae bacterium]|nr:hypothetical protein [Polyangiaceae bacterium]MCB9605247.1 hypothetical protein [Polyangiaceae bacterium]
MIDGKFSEACPKLEQSNRIDPAIGTLLYLAECYEKEGKTASAWATFSEASSKAQAEGQTDRAEMGRSRAQALEPKLSRLSLQVGAEARAIPGYQVKRSGEVVDASLWGVPVPIDPGEYAIVISAPGYQEYSIKVRVEGEGKTVEAQLPALIKAKGEPAAEAPPETPPPAVTPTPAPAPGPRGDEGTSDGSGQRTAGIIVGGLGLAGIAVGSVFGLQAISKNSDAEKFCPRGSECDSQQGVDLTDDAKSAATVSNIAFGVGAAALIGGLVLYFTAPDKPQAARLQRNRWQVSPVFGGGTTGFGFMGAFQ